MNNTTNDPAAQYGDKPTEREPMLSEPFSSFLDAIRQAASVAACAAIVRDKITSGELRVVQRVVPIMDSDRSCPVCGHWTHDGTFSMNFCPAAAPIS
jgi:hypothetical protein